MQRIVKYKEQGRGAGTGFLIGSGDCADMPGADRVLARHLSVSVSPDGKTVTVQPLAGTLPDGSQQETFLAEGQGDQMHWRHVHAGGKGCPITTFPARLALGSKTGPQVLLEEIDPAAGLVKLTVQANFQNQDSE